MKNKQQTLNKTKQKHTNVENDRQYRQANEAYQLVRGLEELEMHWLNPGSKVNSIKAGEKDVAFKYSLKYIGQMKA